MLSKKWKLYLNPKSLIFSPKKPLLNLVKLCHNQDFKAMYPYFSVSILFLIQAIATRNLCIGLTAIFLMIFSLKYNFFAKLEIFSKKIKNMNMADVLVFVFNLCFFFCSFDEFEELSNPDVDVDCFKYFEIVAVEFFFLINMHNLYFNFFSSLFFVMAFVVIFCENFEIYHWVIIFLSHSFYIFHLNTTKKKEPYFVSTMSRETAEERIESSFVLNLSKLIEKTDTLLIVDSTRKPIYFSEDGSLKSIQEIYKFFSEFQFTLISAFKEEEEEIHLGIVKNVFQRLKEEEEYTFLPEYKNLSLEKLFNQIILEKQVENNVFYIQYTVFDKEQDGKNIVIGVLTRNRLILKFKQDFIFKDWLKLSHQMKNQQKAISFVAHEFRTPLNCIVNMLQCLEYYIYPDLSNEYVFFS